MSAAIGIYDLCTRRRLYPVYIMGFVWVLVWQATATSLYFAPFWNPIALALLVH